MSELKYRLIQNVQTKVERKMSENQKFREEKKLETSENNLP